MADKLDSQRMRGFGNAQTNDCDSRAAFAMKRLKKFKDKKSFFCTNTIYLYSVCSAVLKPGSFKKIFETQSDENCLADSVLLQFK